MREDGGLVHRLRNTTAKKMIRALERSGFVRVRSTQSGSHIYKHLDGRMTVVHYHNGSDTFTRKTLASILEATRWNEEDVKNAGLLADRLRNTHI